MISVKDKIINNKDYITEWFFKKTNEEIISELKLNCNRKTFSEYCKRYFGLIKKPRIEKKWTEEEFDWLKQNYKNDSKIRWVEFTKKFNEHFNSDRSPQSLKYKVGQIDKYKITLHRWTEEEKQWCIDNIDNYTYSDLTKEFEKKFNCKLSGNMTIKSMLYNRIGKKKSKEAIGNLNATTSVPIGTIRWTNNYGYVIKVSNLKSNRSNRKKIERINWRPYKEYLWKQNYGEIPKGYKVIFKDGNKRNCVIENLIALSNSSMASMACNDMWGKGEMTQSFIETLQAIDTINEFKSKNGL